MAIKGKSRTKSRPRGVARPPKPTPVVVKPAFFLRRWVQVALAFVVGVGAMVVLTWATNGVREQNTSKENARKRESARRVVQEWQTTVDATVLKVGEAGPAGSPPLLFTSLSGAIDAASKGDVSKDLETTATNAQDLAKSAADDLDHVDLAKLIAGKGLNVEEAVWVTSSQKQMVHGLRLYGEVATLMVDAAKTTDVDQRRELADRAAEVRNLAESVFQDGYSDYQQALASVGIFVGGSSGGLPPGVTGLPGG